MSLKGTIARSKEREEGVKRRIGEELEANHRRQEEVEELVVGIRKAFDRNVKRLREHQKKQLNEVMEANRSEIDKWQKRYSSLKSEQSVRVDRDQSDAQEKKEFEETIRNLKKNVTELREKNDGLRTEISDIKREKSKINEELRDLKHSTTFTKSDLEKKDTEVTRLRRQINDLKSEIKMNQELLKESKKELSDDAKRWKDKYESVQEDYEKLRNQQRKRADSKAGQESQDSKDIGFVQDELKMAQIEIHSLKRKLDTKTVLVDTLHVSIRKNEKLISELEEKLADETENVKKCTQKVELYRNELEEKKDELEQKSTELKRIKSELEDNERNSGDNRKTLEATRENEKKWKAKSSRMEERVESLLKEVEDAKRLNASLTINVERKQSDIDKLKADKARLQKGYDKLKEVADGLNTELDNYHNQFENVATSKDKLVQEKGSWDGQFVIVKKDLERAMEEIQRLHENQDEMASVLSIKENEIENAKSEVNYLNGRLEEYQRRIVTLEERIEEYKRSERTVDHWREQVNALKEETSEHITNVNLLSREKYLLTGQLQALKEKERDLRKRLHNAEAKYEECEKKLKNQKKVYEQQEAQQMKLIDFLKEQNAQNEKKKKPFLTINSKIVGEEGSKALKAEQDKNHRLNDELDELRKDYDKALKEVRQLKCQLVELHNHRDPGMFTKMPCKFKHNFDIVSIEHSASRMCFKCGKKLYKSAQKCGSCGITTHVDCKIETNTCGVKTESFQPAGCETTPINSDTGSTTSGSPQPSYYRRATAPVPSETEEDDENDLLNYDLKLNKMEEKFYLDNNISPSKRKGARPGKSSKRNRISPDKFSFSDSVFKGMLD